MLGIDDAITLYPILMDAASKLKPIIDEIINKQKAKKECIDLLESAQQYFEKGKYALALSVLEKADNEDLLREYYSKVKDLTGLALIGKDNLKEALEYFEATIKRDPRYADAWCHKGLAHYMLGEREAALESVESAIELDKNHVGAWYVKAKIIQDLGKFDDARDIYVSVVMPGTIDISAQGNPSLLIASKYEVGNTYLKQEMYKPAIDNYDMAISFSESDASYKAIEGDIALKDMIYRETLERNRTYAAAWYKKCRAFKALGRTAEADEACAKAKEFGYPVNSSSD